MSSKCGPKSRATVTASFDDSRRFTACAQLHYLSRQFEDDLDSLPTGAVALVDLLASVRLTRNLDLFLAVDNLFDRQYLVGRSGVDTVGQPRFAHGGLRIHTR